MHIQITLKKLFTSFAFFILVFFIISLSADFCYIGRNASSDASNPGWTGQPDFKVFWQTGKNFARVIKTRELSDEFAVYDKKESFYHFRYPPFMALAVVPFGKISFPYLSLLLWAILVNLSLFFAIILLKNHTEKCFSINIETKQLILWGAFLGTLRYYLMIIGQGQTDAFVALFLVLFLVFYSKDRDILSGIFFALILQMKLFFLPALFYFLIRKRFKLVFSASISSLILLILPAAFIGIDLTVTLTKNWIDIVGMSVPSQLLNFKNQSLPYGLFIILSKFGELPVKNTIYIIGAASTLFSYGLMLRFRKNLSALGEKFSKYYDCAGIVLVSVLLSPISWEAYYICLIIPLALTLYLAMKGTEKKTTFSFLAGYFVFSCMFGTDLTKFIPVVNTWRFTNISLGTLLIVLGFFYRLRKRSEYCS